MSAWFQREGSAPHAAAHLIPSAFVRRRRSCAAGVADLRRSAFAPLALSLGGARPSPVTACALIRARAFVTLAQAIASVALHRRLQSVVAVALSGGFEQRPRVPLELGEAGWLRRRARASRLRVDPPPAWRSRRLRLSRVDDDEDSWRPARSAVLARHAPRRASRAASSARATRASRRLQLLRARRRRAVPGERRGDVHHRCRLRERVLRPRPEPPRAARAWWRAEPSEESSDASARRDPSSSVSAERGANVPVHELERRTRPKPPRRRPRSTEPRPIRSSPRGAPTNRSHPGTARRSTGGSARVPPWGTGTTTRPSFHSPRWAFYAARLRLRILESNARVVVEVPPARTATRPRFPPPPPPPAYAAALGELAHRQLRPDEELRRHETPARRRRRCPRRGRAVAEAWHLKCTRVGMDSDASTSARAARAASTRAGRVHPRVPPGLRAPRRRARRPPSRRQRALLPGASPRARSRRRLSPLARSPAPLSSAAAAATRRRAPRTRSARRVGNAVAGSVASGPSFAARAISLDRRRSAP